ncbi:U3 small nucleolar RNA-associated protein 6 homolog isoform X1 [Nilaparvata lugens]|uniref:U3 small nucleolar RNA-associated protein 6 homolog isoform X1 n=1 Tax=Nilaparvata lugens TaxID=108931 RepID=UPI00193D1C74|nr:U3 small nucleolar RNA-associated protein 6 homolog isoform X1 [Nilaparvata lugens]
MAVSVTSRAKDPFELILMEKLQLFTKAEIKKIKSKRSEFSNKIAHCVKKKKHILQFIDYEITLLFLVRTRKQQKGLSTSSSKSHIEVCIAVHVTALCNRAILSYPNDLGIWLSYIKFCRQICIEMLEDV